MNALPAKNIASCSTPSADQPPPTPTPILKALPAEKEAEMTVPKKLNRRAFWRDADTIELIAQDFLENPSDPISKFEKTWKMTSSSLYRIRNGTHNKIAPKTVQMLKVAFCNVSPAGMTGLLQDYKNDRESLPEIIRRRIETVLPKEKLAGLLPAPPQLQKIEPKKEPEIAQVKEIHLPRKREFDAASLREILEVAREAMAQLGVTKVVLPARGDIVVHRKEVLA